MAAAFRRTGRAMKRTVYISAAVAVLAALGVAWFLDNFERVETQVWVGPSAAARSNPYLAAMRFLERLGLAARLEEQPARLQAAPTRTTVILPAARPWLGEARAQEWLRAVENGGHLIVEPEPVRSRDPLLDALSIARRNVKPAAGTFDVEWPGAQPHLQIAVAGSQVLELGRAPADLVVADAHGVRLASMRRGAGRVSVMTGLQRFDNGHIGSHDHAELLRRLAALEPAGEVLIVRAAGAPPLWDWLVAHALPVLIAGSILIVLGLWRTLPRFGPVVPAAAPPRRQLLEHLRAAGRFAWKHGSRGSLLGSAREQVERHIALAAPRLAHLPPQRRYGELAAQLESDAGTLAYAFQATPRNAREMVQITATLASIHAGLRGARARTVRARKRR
jgi:hypothetical protein